MKRPAFQFYPGDWQSNANLRRCTPGARGVWIDILCLMHDAEEYGILRWTLKDVALGAGASMSLVKELVAKNVLKGADVDAEPFVHIPRHAGKNGEPVVLVTANGGPVWYSSRFVRDEWVRSRRGIGSHFGEDNPSPKWAPNQPPIPPPTQSPTQAIGDWEGDGPAVCCLPPSSLRSEGIAPSVLVLDAENPASTDPPRPNGKRPLPKCPAEAVIALYHEVLPELPRVDRITWPRRRDMRQRWREWAAEKHWDSQEEGLAEWRKFFDFVRKSDFLMGKKKPQPPRTLAFVADIDFLMDAKRHTAVFEGKYHES